jgi:hypothetical protein
MNRLSRITRNLTGSTKWILGVVGPWVLAAILGIGNHLFFTSLHNKDVSQYSQFWITVLKNTWAMLVHACIVWSASTAFIAIVSKFYLTLIPLNVNITNNLKAWSSLLGRRLSIKSVDSVLQLPSLIPTLQIIFSPAIQSLHQPVYWSACLAIFALVTITPPAALVVRPMQPVSMQLRIPNIDLSADPRLYVVIGSNWEYIHPSNHIHRFMRNIVTSDNILTWDAPRACRHGCTYNTTYYAPVLRCVDYTPNPLHSELEPNETYHTRFNLSDSYLTFNMTLWPISNGKHKIGGFKTSPIGTRCTFHNGSYTAAITFGRNLQRASVTNRTIISDDLLVGTSLGFTNTSTCPRNKSWQISQPLNTPPCARIQMNTWALIDAFSHSLAGTIVIYPKSIGPKSRYSHNALMPNLDYLFSVDELSRSFDLAPWVYQQGLGNALESLFANATLSLTRDALSQNWTSVTQEALVIPFVNRYVYEPSQLWLVYASALLATLGAGLAGYSARKSGKAPSEETSLSRILATTRDESFKRLEGMNESEIDKVVIQYDRVQVGDEHRMAFKVVSYRGSHGSSPPSEVEETGLLYKT